MRRAWPFALAGLLVTVAATRDAVDRWVDATVLPPLVHDVSVEVRDRNDALLRAYPVEDGRWRMAVTPDGVDPDFVAMLIAYEDKRFYSHAGVDALALLRAAGQAVRHGRIVSGGSTLTMQVARLLEDSGTGRWQGKLRQIRVALALERQQEKADILGLYLRLAPYGGNIEGVRAAALAYFGKEPRRLTPAEAAFLVALPQAPEARRPDRHPQAARRARDRVLTRLVAQGVLDAGTARASLRDPAPERRLAFPMLAAHLADRAVATAPERPRHALTVERGLQRALEALAVRVIADRGPGESIAILVADHRTGEVLASVGSAGYADSARRRGYLDMTQALRSPGSTLKPLVYALAFDRGMAHPETVIADTPVRFGRYAPQNFDNRFRGDVTIREALQASLNIPVVRLVDAMGPAHLMAALRKAGARPALTGGTPGLAVALGGVGVSLQDMVQLYATLARGGTRAGLHWQAAAPDPAPRVVGARAAWHVGQVLSGIPPPPGAGLAGQVAYKTGTSYGFRDAWALGYDGAHVIGVWMGRPDGTPVPGAFGADAAAPVLFEAFARLRPLAAPLPPPPADALILPNAGLPPPLQRFRHGESAARGPALELAFPPDGARLEPAEGGVVVKLRHGTEPFTVLANGGVLASGLRGSAFIVPLTEPGFSRLSVIDARGASDSVSIELR
jgi:penicillin-binding protein 1C